MSNPYHEKKDLALMKDMRQLAPADFDVWLSLDKTVGRTDGAIPQKYRELIAVAVAVTTQCRHCIEHHAKRARKAGCGEEELAEATMVATALRDEDPCAVGLGDQTCR